MFPPFHREIFNNFTATAFQFHLQNNSTPPPSPKLLLYTGLLPFHLLISFHDEIYQTFDLSLSQKYLGCHDEASSAFRYKASRKTGARVFAIALECSMHASSSTYQHWSVIIIGAYQHRPWIPGSIHNRDGWLYVGMQNGWELALLRVLDFSIPKYIFI